VLVLGVGAKIVGFILLAAGFGFEVFGSEQPQRILTILAAGEDSHEVGSFFGF
jgi:hypothetical protein